MTPPEADLREQSFDTNGVIIVESSCVFAICAGLKNDISFESLSTISGVVVCLAGPPNENLLAVLQSRGDSSSLVCKAGEHRFRFLRPPRRVVSIPFTRGILNEFNVGLT
mmetsp:Transcript_21836/g.32395  ORF Transcript_21836/g.32395 Transcript_21836/m.32395 type:complete len:110 (+) Transcript_21836:1131-1460(+)